MTDTVTLDDTPSPRVNRVGARGDNREGGPPTLDHDAAESAVLEGRWIPVCRPHDIVPNTGVCALVNGSQVAVFRLDDDSFHAIDNRDPFSRANVLSRGIVGDLKGELVVASPVYKQHFSLASGQCLEDPTIRVAVFRVRLEGGMVMVQSTPYTPAPSNGG